MRYLLPFLVLLAGCGHNEGVALTGFTDEERAIAQLAIDDLRTETGGLVNRYLEDHGATLAVVMTDEVNGNQAAYTESVNGVGVRTVVRPLGRTMLHRILMHEFLHAEGLKHVLGHPEALMTDGPIAAERLADADRGELCRVFHCIPEKLPIQTSSPDFPRTPGGAAAGVGVSAGAAVTE
jgi:hypothetical protein